MSLLPLPALLNFFRTPSKHGTSCRGPSYRTPTILNFRFKLTSRLQNVHSLLPEDAVVACFEALHIRKKSKTVSERVSEFCVMSKNFLTRFLTFGDRIFRLAASNDVELYGRQSTTSKSEEKKIRRPRQKHFRFFFAFISIGCRLVWSKASESVKNLGKACCTSHRAIHQQKNTRQSTLQTCKFPKEAFLEKTWVSLGDKREWRCV